MKILAVIVAVIISLSMFASVSFASGNDLELCSTKPSVIYEKSADGSTVNIECYNIDEYPVAIVLVLYNQGKLVDVMTSYGSSSAVSFTPECQYDSERVMVWDSLEGMKPIVASDDIIYSQKRSTRWHKIMKR